MKRINWLIVLTLIVTALGVGTVSASNDSPSTARTARAADTIVVGTTDQISKLDPADAYSYHDWEILRNTSEGLLRLTPGTTDLELGIAAAMPTVSEDGLTYTFELKPDLKFADGTPYGAAEVAASINRVITLDGDPAWLVSGYVASVEAVDNTVVFTLLTRYDLFPLVVATVPYVVINPNDYPAGEINNFPASINGNGAYSLVSYTPAVEAVFAANPNYHGEAALTPNIIVRYYTDSPQLSLALESGEVDVAMRTLSPTELTGLRETEGINIVSAPGRIIYIVFQHETEAGGNADIRRGFAYGLDRDEIVDRALGGSVSPLYSMIPQGFLGANEAFLDAYGFADVDAAKAAFEAAGGTEDAPLQLELWYPPEHYGDQMVDVVTVVKEQLERTGVVQVTLQVAEWSTYIDAATNGDYPIFMLGWFFDFADSSNYIDPFAECGGSDNMGVFYCTDQMDALIDQTRAEVNDPEARAATFGALQQFYAEEVVTLPLYVATENYAYRDGVDGVIYGSSLEFRFQYLTKE
jgi:peptide/nickel transport system substrate-binding protein